MSPYVKRKSLAFIENRNLTRYNDLARVYACVVEFGGRCLYGVPFFHPIKMLIDDKSRPENDSRLSVKGGLV